MWQLYEAVKRWQRGRYEAMKARVDMKRRQRGRCWHVGVRCCMVRVSSKNINCVQRIQNVLVLCVADSKVHCSSNSLLQQLHWLPIHHHSEFWLAKPTFLARSSSSSSYFNTSVASHLPSRLLYFQDTCLLAVPRSTRFALPCPLSLIHFLGTLEDRKSVV